MEKSVLESFMASNNLRAVDLAKYWGMTRGAVSQILNGTAKLSPKRIEQLLDSPYDWDTSMFTTEKEEDISIMGGVVQEPYDQKYETLMSLMKEVRDQNTKDSHIEYLEQKVKDQDTLIQELCKQVGMLKAELDLARKGEIASIVVGSSDVNVV